MYPGERCFMQNMWALEVVTWRSKLYHVVLCQNRPVSCTMQYSFCCTILYSSLLFCMIQDQNLLCYVVLCCSVLFRINVMVCMSCCGS